MFWPGGESHPRGGDQMADRLDFELDVELETGLITGHAGVPGLIEAFRQTGTAAVIDREIKLKRRKRGLSTSEMVEACRRCGRRTGRGSPSVPPGSRAEPAAGPRLAAAQTARDFLVQFHGEDLPLLQEGKASVPTESVPLLGLANANTELILDLQMPSAGEDGNPRCRRHRDPLRQARGQTGRSLPSRKRGTAIAVISRCWRCGPSRT